MNQQENSLLNQQEISSFVRNFDYNSPVSDQEFEEAIDILTQFLLFDTKWESMVLSDPKARLKIPIIFDVPLLCKAADCEYAQRCPIIKNMKSAEKAKLIGTECRADKLYAVQEFASFVKSLGIETDQTTDIINVASIVRLLIFKRRIDWTLSIEGMMRQEPGQIDIKTGQVYWKPVVHPLFKVSESLETQISRLQKQLAADKQSRMAMTNALGSNADILKQLFTGGLGLPLERNNPIDVPFDEVKEQVEE